MTATAICRLGHGLCIFTAVPTFTQPSTLGLSNNNNMAVVDVDGGGLPVDSQCLLGLRSWQSFRAPSNQVLLANIWIWSPPLHTLYISSPSHCPPFATHSPTAPTIVICFAVVPRLCPLFLVYLSTPYLKLCVVLPTHSSDHSCLCPLKCHLIFFPYILLCTQLLYSLPFLINDISLLICSGTELFHPTRILASTAAAASQCTLNMSPKYQNLSTKFIFALAPISTLVRPVLVTGFKQPL